MPRHPVCKFSVAGSRPRARRHRYWIGAALGALALASPLAIAAGPAAAQGIQFGSVSGDGSGDLTITVTSDYPLTDWTISLSNGTSTYTMDDFTDFTDKSGTFTAGTPQTYVLDAADAATVFGSGSGGIALPPGTYTATATAATDSNGDTLPSPQTLTGTFSFLAQPTMAFSSPSFSTTQPNQSVTINGQITGCSTVACPSSWSGTSVAVTDVTAAAKPVWTTTNTGSSGGFSVSVTGVPGDSYSASVQAVPGISLAATAPSDTQDVPQYAQTSIMATAKPAVYGKQSITGTLKYQSGLQQVAAPAGVTITATAGSHTLTATTTSSGGAFTLTVPPITGMTTWLLSTQNNLATSPFLAGTQSSVGATQLWPVKISFSAKVDKYGFVTAAGCMSPTISQRPPADDPTIVIQWRGRRSGPWHEVGTVGTLEHDGCAGLAFWGQGPAPAASAYYRADFAGDSIYAHAASASTGRVWIYPTRLNRFRSSSGSVAAGQKVTIRGTLQYNSGKWRGYGGRRIVIIFSKNGKNNWFLPPNETVRTNSKGAFSWTFADTYHSEYWQAIFGGNAKHRYASSRLIRIKVHGQTHAAPVLAGHPVIVPRAALGAHGSVWPFVLSPDPWLALMGD